MVEQASRFSFSSLRTKLLVASLALALTPLVAVLVIGSVHVRGLLVDQAGQSLQVQAEQAMDKIERNRFERYGDVQAFAANPLAQGEPAQVESAADFYTKTYGMYDVMLIADLEGKVIAANRVSWKGEPLDTRGLIGSSVKSEPWFGGALKLKPGETWYSDALSDARIGKIAGSDGRALIYAAPVFGDDGKPARIWCNFASFERSVATILADQRTAMEAHGQKVETTLLAKDGLVLDDYDPQALLQLNLAEKGLKAAQAVSRGESGYVIEEHLRLHVEQVNGYARSKGALGFAGNQWGALVRLKSSELDAEVRPMQLAAALLGLAAAGLVALGALILAAGVAKPVKVAARLLREIGEGEGDLTRRLPELSRDEIGDLARGFNGFTHKLDDIVQRTKLSAEEVAIASQQVADSTSHLSTGAQTQAASVLDITSRLTDQAAQLREQAAQAQQARQLSLQSQSVAEGGGAAVSKTREAMAQIKESSTSIGSIIGAIDDIAFQTNLLSLNAAVEAARAGEHGRGFAVVAAEVRGLAQKSANSAKEIKSLIQESLVRVEAGTKLADESGRMLEQIVTVSRKVSEMIQELAAVADEQSRSMDTVSGSMSSIDRVTQEMAAQSEELNATAESLSQRSAEIRQTLSGFRVSDGQHAPPPDLGRHEEAPELHPSAFAGTPWDEAHPS